jgi:hypothetical protein
MQPVPSLQPCVNQLHGFALQQAAMSCSDTACKWPARRSGQMPWAENAHIIQSLHLHLWCDTRSSHVHIPSGPINSQHQLDCHTHSSYTHATCRPFSWTVTATLSSETMHLVFCHYESVNQLLVTHHETVHQHVASLTHPLLQALLLDSDCDTLVKVANALLLLLSDNSTSSSGGDTVGHYSHFTCVMCR